MLPKTIERFGREIKEGQEDTNRLRERMGLQKVYMWQEETIKPLLSKPGRTLHELCGTVFSVWKEQAKIMEKLSQGLAKAEAKNLMAKAVDDRVFEVIHAERKMLIETANEMISLNPNLTVILANHTGEIVGMSRSKDAGALVKEICQKAGGSGGGSPQLGQGKLELSKLLKIMKKD
jgi:alanyl-tRNA synthetase